MGHKTPGELPKTVAAMTDDPYRSLAWAVNSEGGYEDSDVPYADFYWADFFRERIDIRDFKKATAEGVKLAHSPEAKGLPGYTP